MDGENSGKLFRMDDLGVPVFSETSNWGYSEKKNLRLLIGGQPLEVLDSRAHLVEVKVKSS